MPKLAVALFSFLLPLLATGCWDDSDARYSEPRASLTAPAAAIVGQEARLAPDVASELTWSGGESCHANCRHAVPFRVTGATITKGCRFVTGSTATCDHEMDATVSMHLETEDDAFDVSTVITFRTPARIELHDATFLPASPLDGTALLPGDERLYAAELHAADGTLLAWPAMPDVAITSEGDAVTLRPDTSLGSGSVWVTTRQRGTATLKASGLGLSASATVSVIEEEDVTELHIVDAATLAPLERLAPFAYATAQLRTAAGLVAYHADPASISIDPKDGVVTTSGKRTFAVSLNVLKNDVPVTVKIGELSATVIVGAAP